MIPIAGTTNSGIRMFAWTQRFVLVLARAGYEEGWAFRRPDGSRAKAADYRENLSKKLKRIQRTSTLIDPECNVWSNYGVQRLGRRFLTTHATIMGVPPHVLELQMRWSTDRAAGARTVHRSMVHTYSEIRNMKETLKQPSQVC